MLSLFALSEILSADAQEVLKLGFSGASLVVTMYFWMVRANRERVSLGIFPVGGFEGTLEPGGIGLWSGRLFLANRSILPTAIVAAQVELLWQGRWLPGHVGTGEGSELPWNLPPSQVFPKDLKAAFDLGMEISLDEVYADQRLRFTFVTVEGRSVYQEVRTCPQQAAVAA